MTLAEKLGQLQQLDGQPMDDSRTNIPNWSARVYSVQL